MHCTGVRHTNYDSFKHAFISRVIRSIKIHIIINIYIMMSLFAPLHNSTSHYSVNRHIAKVTGYPGYKPVPL
jgi:dTDP-4-dehydrorhamnose reductase